ncbi:MAG: hypothetical protein HY235_20805 [Acidobacteria bacterium]|nr:hypothetical protein [Acidobacteriota bacterium]
MDSPKHTHDEHGEVPRGPEMRDANIPLVVWTGIGILATLFLCMWIAAMQFRWEENNSPKTADSPFSQEGRMPPEPRLQVFPANDLGTFKEIQRKQVDSYGWVDRESGVARVPVDRAMEMVLQKGLPVVAAPKAAGK